MSVLSKLTVQSLKKNKTRTIVTIIGILLSATMICAVTTFAGSLINYGKECTIYTEGNWHTKQEDTDYKTYEDIAKNDKVEQSAYLQHVGYSPTGDTSNVTKPYIYVLGASNDAENLLPIHITSGNYPKNSTEIILPEHLYTDGGIKYEIGDTITLDLGERKLDGSSLTQYNPSVVPSEYGHIASSEVFEKRESRTYTVVGFYDRLSDNIEPYQAPGFTAFTIADATPSDDFQYDVYVRLNNPNDTDAFVMEYDNNQDINTELLMFSGVFKYASFISMLYSLVAIIISLIMLGSIALIYNSFSISVSERTKQFGLLSSIGATKKQIRHMVLFEAFAVSAIGIPLGIICGITGIGITLLFVGNVFGQMGLPIDLTLYVSPAAIIIAIIISLLTVLISAWIPSRRATKVSAVEAIRQTTDIKIKGKKIKTSKLISKLFGVPGVIAHKHYKRNKKKYRATVLSLFMSIVLFISASSFTDYLTKTASETSGISDYEISLSVDASHFTKTTPELLYKQIKSAKGVTDASYSQSLYLPAQIDTKYTSDEWTEYIETLNSTDEYYDSVLYLGIKFINDSTYREFLKENGLSEEMYMNPEKPLAIAIDNVPMFNPEIGKYQNMRLFSEDSNIELNVTKEKEIPGYWYMGQEIDDNGNTVIKYEKKPESTVEGDEFLFFTEEEALTTKALSVGKVIDEIPYFIDNTNQTCLIYPRSLATSVFEDFTGNENSYSYVIKSSNHAESTEKIEAILIDNGITDGYLTDHAQGEESRRNIATVIRVFSYGFVILISLIAAANVFNTVSTNISLRRREFAILKSIGMTRKDFNKMMNFECLLYGSRAILYGLPVSVLVTYLIYCSVSNTVTMPFSLPWGAIGIAVLSVFLVVFVTMLYSMRKIKKDNPIDALKNENL